MATSLYRTFRELYRRRWYVAVIWVGLLEMAGFGPSRVPAARFDAGLPPVPERRDHAALTESYAPVIRGTAARESVIRGSVIRTGDDRCPSS